MNTRGRIAHTCSLAVVLAFIMPLFAGMNASAATLRWTRTYQGASSDYDVGHGVAVAADGSVYVTGYTWVEGQSLNLLLQKYSPTGVPLWTRTYDRASTLRDGGRGVAVAADGSVYVTGHTEVEGQRDNRLLRKYSPTGVPLWTRRYNGGSNLQDGGYGVAVAADGSVYVTGATEVEGEGENLLLQKYSPAGVPLWTRTYNGASNLWDGGYGVVAAADGGVYVTGYTYVEGQNANRLLRKYSSSGVPLWTRRYNGASNLYDGGNDVAVAADGSVYVIGVTDVEGQVCNLLLQKYSPTGVPLWTRTYDGASSLWEIGYGVAVAADGGVYVTGYTYVETQRNLLLQKYSPTGVPLWTKTYKGISSGSDVVGFDVAVAADGSLYVTGFYFEWPVYKLLLQKYR